MTAEDQAEASRPKRPPDFLARLHRQKVTVRIPGQPAMHGALTGFTAYELLITDDRGRDHLVWKGPGLVLDLPEDWRTVKSAEAGGASGQDDPPGGPGEFSSDGGRP
jgi:hypothetical protein